MGAARATSWGARGVPIAWDASSSGEQASAYDADTSAERIGTSACPAIGENTETRALSDPADARIAAWSRGRVMERFGTVSTPGP
jgi:hypothetical protein